MCNHSLIIAIALHSSPFTNLKYFPSVSKFPSLLIWLWWSMLSLRMLLLYRLFHCFLWFHYIRPCRKYSIRVFIHHNLCRSLNSLIISSSSEGASYVDQCASSVGWSDIVSCHQGLSLQVLIWSTFLVQETLGVTCSTHDRQSANFLHYHCWNPYCPSL